MNKLITPLVLLGFMSFPVYATIEGECSGTHEHAAYVCEYIYQARQNFSENFSPPAPKIVTSSTLPSDWESIGSKVPSFTAPDRPQETNENTGFTLF